MRYKNEDFDRCVNCLWRLQVRIGENRLVKEFIAAANINPEI